MKKNIYETPECIKECVQNGKVLCESKVQFEEYDGDILWGDES